MLLLLVQLGLQRQVGHADDGVHRRADLVAHVGQEVALGPGGLLGDLLGFPQLVLRQLGLGYVLGHAIHVGRLAISIPDHIPQGMNPDHAAIDRPLVGIDRIVAGHSPLKGCCIVFERRFRSVLVAGYNIGTPFVHQVIAPVRTGRIAKNSRGALRRVVILITGIERDVPVAGLGQVERLIVEEIGVFEGVLSSLALGYVPEGDDAPHQCPVLVDRRRSVFGREGAAVLAPEHFVADGAHDAVLHGKTHVAGLGRIALPSAWVWCTSVCMLLPIISASLKPSNSAPEWLRKVMLPSRSSPQRPSLMEARIRRLCSSAAARRSAASLRAEMSR